MWQTKPEREQTEETKQSRWGFRGKTVWDWMALLIVPLVLVVIGLLFTLLQDARQQDIEDRRAQQAQKIENQRAKAERELAVQRAQDEALQAYLDQMGNLLLERDLRDSDEDSEVRTLARARTLTVLERLGPSRKTAVMQFLAEAELVQRVGGRGPIITLTGADLRNTDVQSANLSGANLEDADLTRADLDNADLRDANLSNADLEDASLVYADLGEVNVSYADLSAATFFLANLNGADLRDANLSNADLSDADLSDADLNNAVKWTEMQLIAAESLEGTTMPNGQRYEDWSSLRNGKVSTNKFEPAFLIEVGEDWSVWAPEKPDQIWIQRGPEVVGDLLFTNPSDVFDPSNLSEQKKLPAPENAEEWVSWLQSHPNLDTSKPVPVSVGGASGMRIDVTPSSTPENYPRDLCRDQSCVPLYPLSDGSAIISSESYKDRFVIVDVGGQTVLIDVAAPVDKFDAFFPKVQKVLDTVEWKGG